MGLLSCSHICLIPFWDASDFCGKEYEDEKTGNFWEGQALVSVPGAGILHRLFGQDPSGRLSSEEQEPEAPTWIPSGLCDWLHHGWLDPTCADLVSS